MDENRNAGLRGAGGERHAQLGVAATTRPGRGAVDDAQVGIRSVHESGKGVGVVGLHTDHLVALAGR